MTLPDILAELRLQHPRSVRRGRFGWWPARSVFEVFAGAVLTQNTAWTNAARAIDELRAAGCLQPRALLATSPVRLSRLIRSAGYYNVKQRRLRALAEWYVAEGERRGLRGRPTGELRAGLLRVHGVGRETADDILLYAFGRPVFVVDAYTRRLFSRLGKVAPDIPYEDLRALFERELPADAELYGEYHARIVWHGKLVCLARRPRCGECRLRRRCAYGRRVRLSPAPAGALAGR